MKNKIEILRRLNLLQYFILKYAYIEDWDGDDEDGKPIVRGLYVGLSEESIKSLLNDISYIIELVKEEDLSE